MPRSVFPYPGGKSYLAPWIIDHFPDHECYVEVFGGSSAVLVNKPESNVEVVNDQDGDIVHFFKTLREAGEDLADWLTSVPHAKDVHDKWAEEFFHMDRPEDDIERAGKFFYLRYTQFAAAYDRPGGYAASRQENEARRFRNATEQLHEFKKRLLNVQIENRDFEDVIDRYDGEDTLFYCDPPYVTGGDRHYSHGSFDHDRLARILEQVEADWAVSYSEVPDGFPTPNVVFRDEPQRMNNRSENRREKEPERLIMNYDPDESPSFSEANQTALGSYGSEA